MSSHILKLNNPNFEGLIGWDPMLNTYFFHVLDTTKEEDETGYDVTWAGADPDEILDLEELEITVQEYLTGGIPDELWDVLHGEAD